MSLCENCGEREAVVHLTQIVGNSVSTLHLCEQCAAEKGVDTDAAVAKFPLSDFLKQLSPGGETAANGSPAACPACGATLQDFRQTGRLGCARCYQAFEPQLRDLLRRLHGSTQHQGERYQPGGPGAGAGGAAARLGELRERLRQAVAAEDFEMAARLRDEIRGLE